MCILHILTWKCVHCIMYNILKLNFTVSLTCIKYNNMYPYYNIGIVNHNKCQIES